MTQNVRDINRLKYLGLYLRDRIQLNDQLLLSLSGRQDWAQTQTTSLVTGSTSKQSDNAFRQSLSCIPLMTLWLLMSAMPLHLSQIAVLM